MMKMISKIAKVALGLVFIGSSVFAQSLADAKKAIDAEQYQKAKGMLKNLTVTQPTNDENLFYLGWVYIVQDYPDSAKATFTKGIAANPKSALNYVGMGVVALQNKDNAGAASSFNQALTLTSKKDSKPYLYIAKGYLLDAHDGKFPADKANAAIDALNKGKIANPKDAEVMVELGNAYRSQLNSNSAYDAYSAALALDPKSPAANVAEGVLWRYADNFEDSEKQFQAAIAIDPNYGPAYRELAETDLVESHDFVEKRKGPEASAKIKEGVENYKKFLSLTDQSVESLLRYADFLVNVGDYKTLQEVATQLSKSTASNARVYRYLGYAAYENKDYANGLTALDTWFQKAGPSRILPLDYLYLGRLQVASGKDTVKGIENMKKAADLDTNKVSEIYGEIAAIYKSKKDWLNTGKTYEELVAKAKTKASVNDHLYVGVYYYFAFDTKKPDSTLLVKADTALSFVQKALVQKPSSLVFLYRARIAYMKDGDYNNMKGLPKPYYDKYIELEATAQSDKRALAEAYAYEGAYAQYHDKDDAKALDNYTKARDLNPNNSQAKFYFDQKAAPAAPPAKTTTPAKKASK
ncbi:MAG TPA: tetratricopeptide repeat protein [Mucilaginibacter sp.]|nr:tetratricopeptide repeat protein [Mucilaginibacter sp.]